MKDESAKEFKVVVVEEGALGTLLLGSSKLPVKKLESILNKYGKMGWDVSFMLIERKRLFLFWQREAAIITLSRSIN